MGKLDGKTAFITGAARGQGRSHAVRLAEEGADIIAVDLCDQIDSVPYPLATPDDLEHTAELVKGLNRRVFVTQADVRDRAALQAAYDAGVAELGPAQIVVANAGIAPMSRHPVEREWQDVIDVNLSGVYNTVQVTSPAMIEKAEGGSIVLISSTSGLCGIGGTAPGGLGYSAAKHGIVGLMRSYANNLAQHSIRVNSVHPTGVRTPMVENDAVLDYLENDPSMANALANALPVDLIEPIDVSNAVLWLASDDARYVTGAALPVDAGFVNKR